MADLTSSQLATKVKDWERRRVPAKEIDDLYDLYWDQLDKERQAARKINRQIEEKLAAEAARS